MGSEEGNAGRKIMLLAILSLFTVIILIVILHIYTKSLLTRRQRNLDLQRRRWQVDVGGDYNSPEPPKSGLDPSVIAALPAFTYERNCGEPIECAVCLGAVVQGATVRELPNCKHLFHVDCVDTWLGSHTTCPICRAVVEAVVIGPGNGEMMGRGSGSGAQPSAPPLDLEGAQLDKGGASSSSRLEEDFCTERRWWR